MVCWGNAWLTGHVGLDEAVDHVEREGGPCVVGDVPLRGFLADLRVAGMHALRLALPAPGDPLGLTGPPAFNTLAIDAGQAVIAVLPEQSVGLVPAPDLRGSSYSGVRWTALQVRATTPDIPSIAEAEQALSAAMHAATEALASVDGPRPPVPDAALARAAQPLAPGYPARAHRVAVLAARLTVMLHLAEERGLTVGQIATGDNALRELDRAVRRARVAAHHAIFEPSRPHR
ncbi:hypothetical protein Ssi02_38760 [Sinosporangium siamense]|uniref:Uncharacterized protein n=1 Tax=Sinosporangium siamense TaxID=1367973 RepID=A0A919V637_9ACTN|nr:hypothetical protein Ssi02_38760 [Sinosporangium siamense]